MKLTLPYPPTANLYWRVWRGRIRKSKEAREYQRRVRGYVLGFEGRPEPATGPVVVSVALYRPARRGDLDNSLKVMLDALKGLAFEDDGQVAEIHAARFEDPANPRAVVTVEPQESRGTAVEQPRSDERRRGRGRPGGAP